MSWFSDLMGFEEENLEQVKDNCYLKNGQLISRLNDASYDYGEFELVSVGKLKEILESVNVNSGQISVSEVIGNVQDLHIQAENANATFQVASQFNLLEMTHPNVTPESGVTRYAFDLTQGPACAIACGAGTIFRNYFVPINGELGQTQSNQINCMDDIELSLRNEDLNLWTMKNGYLLPTEFGIKYLFEFFNTRSEKEYSELLNQLKVGVQWNTQVTLSGVEHKVTQIYSSALPVAYCNFSSDLWEPFARFILEGTYEATILSGIINYAKTGNNRLFLTKVGGGAFGNRSQWIIEALDKVLSKYQNYPLDIQIVSYSGSDYSLQPLIR